MPHVAPFCIVRMVVNLTEDAVTGDAWDVAVPNLLHQLMGSSPVSCPEHFLVLHGVAIDSESYNEGLSHELAIDTQFCTYLLSRAVLSSSDGDIIAP